jgi:hypothetical protein
MLSRNSQDNGEPLSESVRRKPGSEAGESVESRLLFIIQYLYQGATQVARLTTNLAAVGAGAKQKPILSAGMTGSTLSFVCNKLRS